MFYKGYRIEEENGSVVIENVTDFNPVHIFECGQCFRWIGQDDKSYTGVAKGRVVNVEYRDGMLVIRNSTVDDFINIWYGYFDLERDYSYIKAKLSKDEIMKKAVCFGSGIRLLKQDTWETLISFIISANNRIPMIMKTVAAISENYGDRIEYDGGAYYTFPGVDRLSSCTVEKLEVCKGGFRCRYIVDTSVMIGSGKFDLGRLCEAETCDARNMLMKLPGVGPKVADCTLLYSGTKHDVFPTDVWVKRVMEELYFGKKTSLGEIQDFAAGYFGTLAGFAQQYLFYYARENRIGTG